MSLKEEEKIREYLLTMLPLYVKCREQIGVPVDEQSLQNIIKSIQINIHEDNETTGTFNVNQGRNKFGVIINNFHKNGNDRNTFLLLHELTHLSSPLNKEISQNGQEIVNKYNKILKGNEHLSGIDVYAGLVAIDEVLAQWCCEECNDIIKNQKREKITSKQNILGTNVTFRSDFSDNDIYSPLEQYVEEFAQDLGYSSFKEFARAVLENKQGEKDFVHNNNVERLGYIGLICEGIYQTNGFHDYGLPETDIPIATEYLGSKKVCPTDPEAPGDNR